MSWYLLILVGAGLGWGLCLVMTGAREADDARKIEELKRELELAERHLGAARRESDR